MVKIPIRGTAALAVGLVLVAITLIWLPAYRLFFAISLGIGVAVAAALYLWHRFRPVRDEDLENKRPLGLSYHSRHIIRHCESRICVAA